MKQKILIMLFACYIGIAGMAQEKPKTGLGKILNKADTLLKKVDGKINSLITPPKNLTPADGHVLTEKEKNETLVFSWTTVSPLPKEGVYYLLRIFEVKKGQSPEEARSTGKALVEKTIKEGTMSVWDGKVAVRWPIDVDSKYGWNIQALNIQGQVISSSEPTVFMMSNCFPDVRIRLDSANCTKLTNGVGANHVFGTLTITPVTGVTINSIVYNSFVEYPSLTAIPISSLAPATMPTSGVNSFTILVANALCKKIRVEYKINFTCLSGPQSLLCSDTLTLPCCACNPCNGKRTRLITDSTKYTNNSVSSFYTLTQTPTKLIKVSAQIVDFERMGESGCLKCTKDSKEFGNYTGGSLNGRNYCKRNQ
jgi:hypothetical protein